jgi:LPS sulfotransferase NodH
LSGEDSAHGADQELRDLLRSAHRKLAAGAHAGRYRYAGRPADYFGETERGNRVRELGLPAGDLAAYARAVREAAITPNGVLGAKLMWNDFDRLRSATRVPPGADAGQQFLREAFPRRSSTDRRCRPSATGRRRTA